MRIKGLKLEKINDRLRFSAIIEWEDCDQKNREIYFETNKEFLNGFISSPNALVVASILPAMFFGERRLKIDSGICPDLKEGLITNMNWYSFWYGEKYKPVAIEAPTLNELDSSNTKKTVGLFLSGGVDSLYSLRINRLSFPVNHHSSISDCFLVHGFDIYHDESMDKKFETFDRALISLRTIASDAKVNLIPVYTNIRHLCSDVDFWMKWFHGAALSSVAHVFSGRLHKIILASGSNVANLRPWGSHPAIDSNYSSSTLAVRHDYLRERFDKISLIANWNVALNNMRVCTANKRDLLNCGSCEKCIRTMLALFILGKLKFSNAFPEKNISKKLLRKIILSDRNQYIVEYYIDFIRRLESMGRKDLAGVLKREFGLIGNVKRFDAKYLGGILVKLWSCLRLILFWKRYE